MTDHTPESIRELARRWTATHKPHAMIDSLDCDVCKAGSEILKYPELGHLLIALVNRLEEYSGFVDSEVNGSRYQTAAMTTPLLPR
jgi:hypothetical protein